MVHDRHGLRARDDKDAGFAMALRGKLPHPP
jgi:hypothetical protein